MKCSEIALSPEHKDDSSLQLAPLLMADLNEASYTLYLQNQHHVSPFWLHVAYRVPRCYRIEGGPDIHLTFRVPGLQSRHLPTPTLGFQPEQVSSDESPEIWGFSSMTVISKVGQVFPCHSTGIPLPYQQVLETTGQEGRTRAKGSRFLFMASLLGSNLGGGRRGSAQP